MDPLTRLLYPGSTNVDDGNQYPFTLVEGRVLGVTAAGVTFALDNWPGGEHFKHGPAPWPWWLATVLTDLAIVNAHGTPQTGDRCLVAFLGTGLENPWVIGWWPS